MKIIEIQVIKNDYGEPICILVLFNLEFRLIISKLKRRIENSKPASSIKPTLI